MNEHLGDDDEVAHVARAAERENLLGRAFRPQTQDLVAVMTRLIKAARLLERDEEIMERGKILRRQLRDLAADGGQLLPLLRAE